VVISSTYVPLMASAPRETRAISGNQRQSEAISTYVPLMASAPRETKAISGNQRSLDAISTYVPLMASAPRETKATRGTLPPNMRQPSPSSRAVIAPPWART
jgi:hypothetical protein